MTRSLHTDPPAIRAARRVESPRAPRGEVARRRARSDELAAALGVPAAHGRSAPLLARITVRRPRPGFHHPLTRRAIRDALAFFGPLVVYGLRSIDLRQTEDANVRPILARLQVPGVVILYEQPHSPWRLDGRIAMKEVARLRAAGAIVDLRPGGTTIGWPSGALAEFVLFDGLMHEIGHHLIQHHTGKREARVRRTVDHERAADRFAAACRAAWRDRTERA